MTSLRRVTAVARWVVGVGAATAVVLLFSLEGAPDAAQGPAPDRTDQLVADGAVIYGQRCASCHGEAGQGGQGPRLAGTMVVNYPDAAVQTALVTEGRNAMPAFGSTLTDDEIAAVVAFTRLGLS